MLVQCPCSPQYSIMHVEDNSRKAYILLIKASNWLQHRECTTFRSSLVIYVSMFPKT